MKAPIPGLQGPTGPLLLLLSVAVLTVVFDRGRYWVLWWRERSNRRERWGQLLAPGAAAGAPSSGLLRAEHCLEDWDLEMRSGESLLQAATVLGPLLGLIGTVLGLMRIFASLGPQLLLPAGASLQGYGQVLLSTALGLIISLVATFSLQLNGGLRRWQLGRLRRQWRRCPLQP